MRTRAVAPLALAAALLAAGCGTGGIAKGGDATRGKTLFTDKCAGCHALADAGSVANVGPNLDDAFAAMRASGQATHFSDSTIRNVVLDQIRIAAPPMPANLVTGQNAADVAAYVASVAGKTPAGGTAAASGTATGAGGSDGKAIFSSNCASCHTLAAAGAKGTVGPNLDQLKPGEVRVEKQVTNGGAIMPAFKGKLTDAQIKAVAKFVASAAGKK